MTLNLGDSANGMRPRMKPEKKKLTSAPSASCGEQGERGAGGSSGGSCQCRCGGQPAARARGACRGRRRQRQAAAAAAGPYSTHGRCRARTPGAPRRSAAASSCLASCLGWTSSSTACPASPPSRSGPPCPAGRRAGASGGRDEATWMRSSRRAALAPGLPGSRPLAQPAATHTAGA